MQTVFPAFITITGNDFSGAFYSQPLQAGCGVLSVMSNVSGEITDLVNISFSYPVEIDCPDASECVGTLFSSECDDGTVCTPGSDTFSVSYCGDCILNTCADNSIIPDECDVCGGSGIPDGECDCDGNVEDLSLIHI